MQSMFVMKCVFQLKVIQLLEWFNLNLENEVAYIDAQINDFDGPLQFSPTKRRLHPIVRERVQEKVLESPSTSSIDLVSFINPIQVAQETSDYHMPKIEEKSLDALDWLDDNHPHIWSKSKFSEECKVDYINNNLSKNFNSWVSKTKTCILYKCLTT
jgi:hypothetical protein